MEEEREKIVMTSNTLWFIYNFNLNLIRYLKKNYRLIIVAPKDEYAKKLTPYVEQLVDVSVNSSGMNPGEDALLTYKFYKIYKKIKPNIILSYTIKPNIYGNFAAARLNIPVINTITGLGTIFIKKSFATKIGKILYRKALKYSAHTFLLNQTDINTFLEHQLISPKLASIVPGSGIDTNKFKKERTENKGKTFLFVGRLLGDKGIRECLAAFNKVLKCYPNIELRIAGELGSNNKTAITKPELNKWLEVPQITYLGKTDNIVAELAKADVMVLPSYREGLSRSLLEAASMSLPIISSNVPGCVEVVKDNVNGFLCKPKDIDSLSNRMEKMLNLKEQERLTMGRKGRALVKNEFDEKIVNEVYSSKIHEILSKNKPS